MIIDNCPLLPSPSSYDLRRHTFVKAEQTPLFPLVELNFDLGSLKKVCRHKIEPRLELINSSTLLSSLDITDADTDGDDD